MKTLLLALALVALAATAAHAADTNIAVRATVTVEGISTNQTTLNLSYTNAKEKAMIEGWIYAYERAKATAGQTNTFDWYIARVRVKDDAKAAADDKNRNESALTLEKLTRLLTTDIDLLTAGDLSSLNTIAAKAP